MAGGRAAALPEGPELRAAKGMERENTRNVSPEKPIAILPADRCVHVWVCWMLGFGTVETILIKFLKQNNPPQTINIIYMSLKPYSRL